MIEPPLPFGNAAARWFYVLLRGLVERGHKVTALAACSKPEDLQGAAELFPAPEYDLQCFVQDERRGMRAKWSTLRRPYSFMFSKEFDRAIERELAAGFDILHLEQLWCAWKGFGHTSRALVNVHHLTSIDLGRVCPATWRAWAQQKLMFATERKLTRSFRYFRSSSPRVSEELRRLNPRALVGTVPLGIDASLYPYIPAAKRVDDPVVTLIGSMHWYPGYSAARRLLERLWPEIKARVPNARLQIVGWNACKTLHEFKGLPDVVVEENVADTRPYFERTSVFLYAPERGSGMKVKILEAMAYGVPVVTTSEGVEGLPAVDGKHAGISETDAGLVERTVRLLEDPQAQERQRIAARRLVERHCGPVRTLDGVEAMYDRMMHDAGRRARRTWQGKRGTCGRAAFSGPEVAPTSDSRTSVTGTDA